MIRTKLAILVSFPALLSLAPLASAVSITEFPLPSAASAPSGIAAGPDGALWFTEPAADKIGRITTSGSITEFALPPGTQPSAIVVGPDGALWFTERGASRIGRITTTGAVTHFPLSPGAVTLDIAPGPDGNLWVAYELLVPGPGPLGRIARVTPSGTVTDFDPPSPAHVVTSLAAGPDGQIWFAGYGTAGFGPSANSFAVVGLLGTDGFGLGRGLTGTSTAGGIAAGPDGNVWFTVQTSAFAPPSGPSNLGAIGRITGEFEAVAEFAIPSSSATPSAIASGPDGNLWFADLAGHGAIGRVTPGGAITELAVNSPPGELVGGSDGNVWFTEPETGRIARISSLDAICTPSATALCLDNGRFRVEATWTKSDGTTGPATAVPLGSTSTAGYLWFFSAETPEVTVKTIEGCALNGNVWFFAGGLTNVRVDLKVTDMTVPSGAASKTYTNPLGTPFAPIQDTAAFPCHASPLPPPPNQ